MVSHAFSRNGSFHPSCPVLLPLLGATVARIFTLLKLLAFEILGPELEMLLGEALGSLPVDFWWLPFDLGTRFHYFLCNSATVSSIIKTAARNETVLWDWAPLQDLIPLAGLG